jgi:FeS assembly SUF system regulator
MLKLGKLADYGTMIVTVLAAEPARLYPAQELATRTHVAAPTVSKLLKLLTKAGLVESLRGAHGGYKLARSPDAITVADVIGAIDGPIGLTECSVHKGDCAVESTCGVRQLAADQHGGAPGAEGRDAGRHGAAVAPAAREPRDGAELPRGVIPRPGGPRDPLRDSSLRSE